MLEFHVNVDANGFGSQGIEVRLYFGRTLLEICMVDPKSPNDVRKGSLALTE